MDWDKLRVFHAVAEAGSFTHAGDTLNLSQSAVSRQISALEEALSVPLFHRHARGLILTEQGEALNRTVREVFAKLAMTEALLTESKEKPAGRLKVTTTHSFGVAWLAPRLKTFLAQYPDVTLSLLLDDTDLDLAMREADVAIRMHPPRQPDLVQRHLGEIRWQVWASPDYLKANGTPEKAEDLDNHKLVRRPQAAGAGCQLAIRSRPPGRHRPPRRAGGQFPAGHAQRGARRNRPRRLAGLSDARARRPSGRAAGNRQTACGYVFRLPGRAPEQQTRLGFP